MNAPMGQLGDRHVEARIEAAVDDGTDLVLAIAVAAEYERKREELTVTLDGAEVAVRELDGGDQGRLHSISDLRSGRLAIEYRATVAPLDSVPVSTELEAYRFQRPSRYCQSDELSPLARAEFAGVEKADLLASISSWVGAHVAYVPGSSRPIDGAVSTMLARQGVCRDFAHLSTALLRSNGVPARLASVYAPGLDPMDFHAVTEASIDGVWYVIDATCLAPRQSLVRIATGADASDTAFMTTLRGGAELTWMNVSAVVDGSLPYDDVTALTTIR